ncbi:MAG: hypothetical protein Q9183_007592, partial [Haloplaca sp. 2 TL-2023]
RCPLKYTRAILDAIHSGTLAKEEYEVYETFNLNVPVRCPGVPDELLNPRKSWSGSTGFKDEVTKLGVLFVENFGKYRDEATEEVVRAGPDVGGKVDADKADGEKKTDPEKADGLKANGEQANGTEAPSDPATAAETDTKETQTETKAVAGTEVVGTETKGNEVAGEQVNGQKPDGE